MSTTSQNIYVSVIIPLAIPKIYDYSVPESFHDQIAIGKRVEVSLRNKNYSGLISKISFESEGNYKVKDIIDVLDELPIVTDKQFDFWSWIAKYYCCSVGEVMNVALPQGLKLSSETKLIHHETEDEILHELDDDEFLVTEALSIQEELTVEQVQDLLEKQSVYPVIKSLLDKRVLTIKEELKTGFKPKLVDHVKLNESFWEDDEHLIKMVERSEKQLKVILAYKTICPENPDWISRAKLSKQANVSTSIVKALEKKGILDIKKKKISRIKKLEIIPEEKRPLSGSQFKCFDQIKAFFKEGKKVLLHGITGSGKTQIYIELIKEIISEGGQVLYLLPEIGLTAQIVNRLRAVFGDEVGVYHSRMNHHERVEVWHKSSKDFKIVLAARSGLFLPMQNLKLIIVDESHDPSFKQTDPAPRYNARDAAIYLSNKYNIHLLMGTATPSLESYNNTLSGKYGLVELFERYGEGTLPSIEIVDLSKTKKTKYGKSNFSKELLKCFKETIEEGRQAIFFQNRRGYAPILKCRTCGWTSQCISCDVNMTVHKYSNEIRCHYCGKRKAKPYECERCGSHELVDLGFGTQKIEDEILSIFPEVKVARLDYDTAKSKMSYAKIIADFEEGFVDLLVGTQMITKGLDFDNVGLVAIINADQMLHFPDFRSNERAFQLFTQVAGRAGRKDSHGKVIIQTFDPKHPVLLETLGNDFHRFIQRELHERRRFLYPPYYSLIYLKLKHKKSDRVNEGAILLSNELRKHLANRVIGPTEPGISRIRNMYIRQICVKAERNKQALEQIKEIILTAKNRLQSSSGFKSLRINVDVDPY